MKKNTLSTERIGVSYQMNCGLQATCIKYNQAHDIDVEFEDGTIVLNKTWKNFKNGNISNPNIPYTDYRVRNGHVAKQDYLLSTWELFDGRIVTVTKYMSYHKVEIIDNKGKKYVVSMDDLKRKRNFLNPEIHTSKTYPKKKVSPNTSFSNVDYPMNRIGQRMIMNCGLSATIIKYRNAHDIDVEFEDGCIATHKEFRSFKKGSIKHPLLKLNMQKNKTHFGEKKCTEIPRLSKGKRLYQSAIMNCGLLATIIKYRSANDIDVEFENGIIVCNRRYKDYIRGSIACKEKRITHGNRPNCKTNRIGKRNLMNCGLYATIIKYISSEDISVQFEDGYISEHVKYQCFCRGTIYNPNTYGTLGISRNEYALQSVLKKHGFAKGKQGELSKLGLGRLELDLYNPDFNGHRIAIEYDGGFIYKNNGHTKMRDIRKNQKCKEAGITLIRIREPQLCELNDTSIDFRLTSAEVLSQNFISTINDVISFLNIQYAGNIPLIEMIDRDKILLEFKNEHCGLKNNYYNRSYIIDNDRYSKNLKDIRLAEINKMNCGMDAMIIEYRNRDDIDVEFEDGTIREHMRYSCFKKGSIANPNLKRTIAP